MFNWVVKVVPQPPDALETLAEDSPKTPVVVVQATLNEAKSPAVKPPEEGSDDSQGQSGLLSWLPNGFVNALPQPSSAPNLRRASSDTKSGEDGERTGVIGWMTQGLTKVLPQPDDKYKENNDNEERTEVFEIEEIPDHDPLPHIPVVEMVSEFEVLETDSLTPQFPTKVVDWLKQALPQPVLAGAAVTEPSTKTDKVLSPPPESLSGISLDTDGKAGRVVGWFVSVLGPRLPQPAVRLKDDASDPELLQKASTTLKPDLVLEDVDSDNEEQVKKEACSKAEPEPGPEPGPGPGPGPAPEDNTDVSHEDAETQTGRWTPFINSIKEEAESIALATMEERLLQERVEMTRLAEEVARVTAEMAVRQMTEGGSIKLSLGSQELLEEQDAELQLIREEGNEDVITTE